jgi:hypothetical protein
VTLWLDNQLPPAVAGFCAGEHVRELAKADLFEVGKALATVVPIVVDDQILQIVEGDLVGEDDLAVKTVRDALLEELDRVGPLPVRRRLADRAAADDVFDVPVPCALQTAARVQSRPYLLLQIGAGGGNRTHTHR